MINERTFVTTPFDIYLFWHSPGSEAAKDADTVSFSVAVGIATVDKYINFDDLLVFFFIFYLLEQTSTILTTIYEGNLCRLAITFTLTLPKIYSLHSHLKRNNMNIMRSNVNILSSKYVHVQSR